MRETIIFACILWFGFSSYAQKIDHTSSYREIKSNSYFRFNYDNDFFASADKNYTQGYQLELVLPFLKKNPINHLFFQPKNNEFTYGLALEHIGFTPGDYVSKEIQVGDRPFASAIMLKSFLVAKDTVNSSRMHSALSLGIIWPAAFGGEMQRSIHEATGNKIPYGWRNQIKNDIVLNYQIGYEKQLFRYADFFSLQGQSEINLGTLFTNFSVGANATLGIINNGFSSVENKNKFEVYAFAQPVFKVVGYDASIQGGLFNNESVYTISSNDINRFTRQTHIGIIVKTQTLYFEYTRTTLTPEFEGGNTANWGGIKIGFTF
ncbi:lipid A deacylase LpxR family protein [Salegentibacter sp. Hel_I_6]|uniref:lipid A deacylase LpxR family protein n=1 Tax=Salegentibacter sp. Hel_I_6 TaxID=1250278 RepID=UPI00055F9159|nr:lipid A deacylase LpxR family protein [Salegentibacter sp. Hel_I_6]